MNLETYTIDYLSHKIEDFKINKRGKSPYFSCPICMNVNCHIVPNSNGVLFCYKCQDKLGTVIDVMMQFHDMTEEEVIKDIKDTLKLDITLNNEQAELFDFYEKNGFDIVPVAANQKIPIEKDWPNKEHKDRKEWETWIDEGLNMGVKTGKRSNVTVIDVDQSPIPAEINSFITKFPTLHQTTNKGYHFFYQYEADLPKTRLDDFKIDIENDGGQVVVTPSRVDDKSREMHLKEIIKMPEEFKAFLKEKLKPASKTHSEEAAIKNEEIEDSDLGEFKDIGEGNRTNSLMQTGGILRKRLNPEQTAFALDYINKKFCNPPITGREFSNIVNSIDRYRGFDELEMANSILDYLKVVEETTGRDIREAKGFKKEEIDNCLSYLIKEGFVQRRNRMFRATKKAQWREDFMDEGKVIDFNMPYFYDAAVFRSGDMLVIGAKQKVGKSHIAMNIVKQLVDQGKKPHYVSLESGSRFVSIAKSLGLSEGHFKWCVHFSPQDIELEPDGITIIDWLLPDNYAEVDKLYKYFVEQLVKHKGILIIFVQLKDSGEHFSKNMIAMFPALVCKYEYTDEEKGITGRFVIDYMREPKIQTKKYYIPCMYDWKKKTLDRVEKKMEKENDSVPDTDS